MNSGEVNRGRRGLRSGAHSDFLEALLSDTGPTRLPGLVFTVFPAPGGRLRCAKVCEWLQWPRILHRDSVRLPFWVGG